jgi:uncharacterized membrane protein
MKKLINFNWVNGLGLSFIFTGFLYFLKIAAEAGWLPPELRAAVGILFGASGIYIGMNLFRKSQTKVGESIAGFGSAMIYATLAYVGFSEVFSFSANALLISMLGIGGVTLFLAVKSNMRIFTLLSSIGGLITTLVIKAPESHDFMLFIYLLIINIGCISLSYYKKWNELKVVSFVLTLLIYRSYYTFFDPIQWQKPMAYITCFFLIYLIGFVVAAFKNKTSENLTDTYLGILNAVSYVFWSTLILSDFNLSHLLPLGLVSGLYVAIGFLLYKSQQKTFNLTNSSYLVLGGLCLAIVSSNSGMVLNYGLEYVVNSGVWLLILIAVYWIGIRFKNQLVALGCYLGLFLLCCYWFVYAWDVEWVSIFGLKYIPFFNAGALIWIGLVFTGFYFSRKEELLIDTNEENPHFSSKSLSVLLGLMSHVIVGGLLTVQISNLWEAYQIQIISKNLLLSICWMLYALIIFILSSKSKQKIYFYMGSVVIVLTSFKVFFWDLSGSATYQKMIFLMIVGGITLLTGFFYGKQSKEEVKD